MSVELIMAMVFIAVIGGAAVFAYIFIHHWE